jgi:biotin carboxyl carrier protein
MDCHHSKIYKNKKVSLIKKEIEMAENKNTRTHYRQLYVKVAPGEIYAFIPGTILEVFVKEGQQVRKGEPLCCLHAMKMDNQICSTIDGVVKSVNIEKGQIVSKNDVLIEVVNE